MGTLLGVSAGFVGEGALRAAPTGWAVAMIGLFLVVCAAAVVLGRLLYVVLARWMRRRAGGSDRVSFRLQLRASLRSPTVVDVLKAVGTSALVAITLTSVEINPSPLPVVVPVLALIGALTVTIVVLEIWLDPELRIPLPKPRRRRDR